MNPHRAMEATVGGKKLELRLDLDRMAALETYCGKGILQIAEDVAALRSDQVIEALCLGVQGATGSVHDRKVMGGYVLREGFHTSTLIVGRMIFSAINGTAAEDEDGAEEDGPGKEPAARD